MAATNVVDDWNERDVKKRASNNWRASLVPAAAVIPAPRVYTKAVAVKKLVVNFKRFVRRRGKGVCSFLFLNNRLLLTLVLVIRKNI